MAFAGVVVKTDVAVTEAVQPAHEVHGALVDQEPDVQPGQSEAGQPLPPHLFIY